ncbi:MAG: helix-turn-helix transcriptional regulator [Acidobacteria bacterium]|nr:helix-turn-helix transcriptional regulator [Acidobacteriota bacterium]
MDEKKKPSAAQEFKEMLVSAEPRIDFKIDAAKLELSEQIFNAMEESAVTEAELARRLDVSRAYVNKILKGTANLTIESLVRIGAALGREFAFAFDSPETQENDVLDAEYVYDDQLGEAVRSDRVRANIPCVFDFKWDHLRHSLLSGLIMTEKCYEPGEFAA